MDTQTNRSQTRQLLEAAAKASTPPHGRISGVQGNFDVSLLQSGASTVSEVEQATRAMLHELGPQHLIANLGEGLTGKEDPILVAAFIDAVHRESEAIIRASRQA